MLQVLAFMGVRHFDMHQMQPHQVNGDVQSIVGTLRAGGLYRRTIDNQKPYVPCGHRLERLPHHPTEQGLHPRHTSFQPLMNRRIADPLLQQGEVPRRLAQHRVNPAVIHHHLHQLLRGLDLARPGKRLELDRQLPIVLGQLL
jgi:hypothetical protein